MLNFVKNLSKSASGMLKALVIPSATAADILQLLIPSAAEQEDLQPYKKTKTSLFFAKWSILLIRSLSKLLLTVENRFKS